MNRIKKVSFFLLFTALQGSILATDDPTKADGPDMQSPENIMFTHSQNLYPDDNPTIRYFQASDTSMNNGIYDQDTKKAETDFHAYTDVIVINGTKQTPKIDTSGKYKDSSGQELESIGIFNEYSENDGQPQIFYLFGKISKVKNNPTPVTIIQNNTQPFIDFNSYTAE
ncbi:hypothetical protein KBC04_03010 [Candidatus Babeliales bacterium]|nr:hypothetical protein [Candidatus Babeliales bacterium]MBP9843978.1 hypothetical protein [Candidatus Babeliales bacterium]